MPFDSASTIRRSLMLNPISGLVAVLSLGFVLQSSVGYPMLGNDPLADGIYGGILLAVLFCLILGGTQLCRSFAATNDDVFAVFSTLIVIAFALLQPISTMNQSPTNAVATIISLVTGSFIAVDLYLRGHRSLGIGCILFWLAVSWIAWVNYDLIRCVGGKWGIGLFGGWKS